MHITILNLKQTLFDDDALGITAPGTEGEFTILPSHIPFLTSLNKGVITIHEKTKKKYIEVTASGIFEFQQNRATILLK